MKMKPFIAPFLTIAIGAAILAWSYHYIDSYKWKPASFPFDFRSGVSTSQNFKVNLNAEYEINLHVERNLPLEQINCLMGIESLFPDRCKDIISSVDMKWSVFSGGIQVSEGKSNQVRGGGWGQTIHRTIGKFQGESGKDYIVKIDSLRDAFIFAPLKPQFKIEVNNTVFEEYYIIANLVAWSGLAIGIFGFIFLMFRMKTELYRKKNT